MIKGHRTRLRLQVQIVELHDDGRSLIGRLGDSRGGAQHSDDQSGQQQHGEQPG